MVEGRSINSKATNFIISTVLGFVALSCLIPLWYTFCLSISRKAAVDAGYVTLYPIGFSLANYKKIIEDTTFFHSVFVSLMRVMIGTPLSVLVIILIAYPLSKKTEQFMARNIIMWLMVFCMLFGAGLIPWYIFMVKYQMINNLRGLILSTGLPIYYVILMMNFFKNIPRELEEAAIVDGAGQWTLLFRIVVPCSVPVIATITLFTGVEYWNEYYNGMLLSTSSDHYPLMTYIKSLVININQTTSLTPEQMKKLAMISSDGVNAAKVFVALLPMLAVYPWLQRYFINGIMIGSVKE